MPFNIGPVELVIILVIALLVIGPGKLPEVGSALGKSIREFRKAATDVQESGAHRDHVSGQPGHPDADAAGHAGGTRRARAARAAGPEHAGVRGSPERADDHVPERRGTPAPLLTFAPAAVDG